MQIIYFYLGKQNKNNVSHNQGWSQYDDDSSSDSSLSSDLEQIVGNKTKNQNVPESLFMKKIVSSPPQFKQQKPSRQQRLAENMNKLNQYKEQKIWLYLIDSYRNEQQTVYEILKKHKEFQIVNKMKQGWNVLIKTQRAAEYIQKGLEQGGFILRFIVSSRNDKNNQKNETNKYQRDNIYKNSNRKNLDSQFSEIKMPKFKAKKTYTQKNIQMDNQQSEKVEEKKRKIKYVAKQQKQFITEPNTIQKLSNQSECISKEVKTNQYQQNYGSIKNKSLKNMEQEQKLQLDVEKHKVQENIVQKKYQQKKNEKVNQNSNQQQKLLKSESILQQKKIQSDSSEQIKKKQKQINKRKSKKKKNSKNSFNDPSNPFNCLVD